MKKAVILTMMMILILKQTIIVTMTMMKMATHMATMTIIYSHRGSLRLVQLHLLKI